MHRVGLKELQNRALNVEVGAEQQRLETVRRRRSDHGGHLRHVALRNAKVFANAIRQENAYVKKKIRKWHAKGKEKASDIK